MHTQPRAWLARLMLSVLRAQGNRWQRRDFELRDSTLHFGSGQSDAGPVQLDLAGGSSR